MSLLSGGCAGIAYGAHGIYSWPYKNPYSPETLPEQNPDVPGYEMSVSTAELTARVGQRFGAGLGEGFDAPNSWNDAVKYPGAWDYG